MILSSSKVNNNIWIISDVSGERVSNYVQEHRHKVIISIIFPVLNQREYHLLKDIDNWDHKYFDFKFSMGQQRVWESQRRNENVLVSRVWSIHVLHEKCAKNRHCIKAYKWLWIITYSVRLHYSSKRLNWICHIHLFLSKW